MKKNIAVVGCGYWGKNLVRNCSELNKLHSICWIVPCTKQQPPEEKLCVCGE